MFTLSTATKRIAVVGLLICAVILGSAFPSGAKANSMLGTAQSFAVLGGSTVTNTGNSVVTGDLGVSPGTAITGFPPGIVLGTIHAADAVALQAQSDTTTAYNTLAGLPCNFNLTGQDLGGKTLIPGVYCFDSSAQLTGTLTLNAGSTPDALFVFQIGSTLTTGSGASVAMIGGSSCNVLWQVGSSATLGTTTSFTGNILALTSISLNNGASINGRALARNGAVTMDNNVITNAACITVDVPTSTPVPPTETPVPGTEVPSTEVPATTVPATEVPSTTVPGTTVPGTPTSVATVPGEGSPVTTPPIGTPVEGTPTGTTDTGTPVVSTPTIITQGEQTPVTGTGTPTISTPGIGTPTVSTPGIGTPTTSTPVTGTPATSTPVITTQSTPSVTVSTSTPTATSTRVTVWFPNTGSGGGLTDETSQSVATTSLAISVALVLLLTGGLAFTIERRHRR